MAKKNININEYIELLLLVGGGFVVYKLLNRFTGTGNEQKQKETLTTVQNEISNQESQGKAATYPDSQYKVFADSIESSLNDTPLTHDPEPTYQAIAAMKNETDVLKLISAFGVRTYTQWFVLKADWTLGQWIANKLSAYERQVLNLILADNGIKYQFQ